MKLVCDPADINEADYFLVMDNENNSELIKISYENYYQRNYNIHNFIKTTKMCFKEEMQFSKYLGEDYLNSGEEVIVSYKLYIYT